MRGHGKGQDGRQRGEAKDGERQDEHREHGELHLARLDLLAEEFRRAPDHQAGNKDRENAEDHEAIETRADAAGQDFAELDEEHRHHAAQPGEASRACR